MNNDDFTTAFRPALNDPVFSEVLNLVKINSKGKIWIIGGFVYRNIIKGLKKYPVYNKDIDFVVEEKNESLLSVPGWQIETNSYGHKNYIKHGYKMSFTDIHKPIRINGIKNASIEEFLIDTPLNIQSIGYDLENNILLGQIGIRALRNKVVTVNNPQQAEFYAKKKKKTTQQIITEKYLELGF